MCFAKDEPDFNALKNELVRKAKGFGYDDCVAWDIEQVKIEFKGRAKRK